MLYHMFQTPLSWLHALLSVSTAHALQAIRAGVIDATKAPYRFALPPTWHEGKVANIQSGNFCQVRDTLSLGLLTVSWCVLHDLIHQNVLQTAALSGPLQPRCDEPWTEVVFEASAEGKVTVRTACNFPNCAPVRRLFSTVPSYLQIM
jgi:hypothetical protein